MQHKFCVKFKGFLSPKRPTHQPQGKKHQAVLTQPSVFRVQVVLWALCRVPKSQVLGLFFTVPNLIYYAEKTQEDHLNFSSRGINLATQKFCASLFILGLGEGMRAFSENCQGRLQEPLV